MNVRAEGRVYGRPSLLVVFAWRSLNVVSCNRPLISDTGDELPGVLAKGSADKDCRAYVLFLAEGVGDDACSGAGDFETRAPVHKSISSCVVCSGKCVSKVLLYFCKFLSACTVWVHLSLFWHGISLLIYLVWCQLSYVVQCFLIFSHIFDNYIQIPMFGPIQSAYPWLHFRKHTDHVLWNFRPGKLHARSSLLDDKHLLQFPNQNSSRRPSISLLERHRRACYDISSLPTLMKWSRRETSLSLV